MRGLLGHPQGCELHSQGVILLTETIIVFVCFLEPLLPGHDGRVVQETSQITLKTLMSLKEILIVAEQHQSEVLTICPTDITGAHMAYEGQIGVSTPGTSIGMAMPM